MRKSASDSASGLRSAPMTSAGDHPSGPSGMGWTVKLPVLLVLPVLLGLLEPTELLELLTVN